MIKQIMHDPLFLARKSENAAKEDLPVAKDLLDTLAANKANCVGMAANMIGVNKRIIIFDGGFAPVLMLNPEITDKKGEYEAEEGCLSLSGTRKTKRWREITVRYTDTQMKPHTAVYRGYVAQIIQHEIDHTLGILI